MEKPEFFAQLNRMGIDTQQALDRFMGNEALFLSFLCKLPEKLDFSRICQALETEDEETFYLHVHNLKGMAGNLSIEPIFDCAQAILVEFRASRFQHKRKLTQLVREAEGESQALSAAIQQYLKRGDA